jgi:type VI secretion system protein VasG
MSVNLKSLVARLDDVCRGALDGAAGLCLSRTNYDVDVEHYLVKLLETPDTDLIRILKHYSLDGGRIGKDC